MTTSIINLNATINTRDFGAAAKESIWSLSVFKGDLIDVHTVDGLSDDYKCTIHLTNWFTGSVYSLDTLLIGRVETWTDEATGQDWDVYVSSENRADRLIEKIKAKGVVNLDNWIKLPENYF